MAKEKCNVMHKLGPFVVDKNKDLITRTCYCCNNTFTYKDIGEDIKEAIKRQEDVSFFVDILLNKKYNGDSDNFIKLISFLVDDLDYLFINIEAQEKLLNKISSYNMLFHEKNSNRYILINNVCEYLKLYFAKNRYEYKNGFDSFPENDVNKLDYMSDDINKRFDNIMNEKKHLSK